MSPSESPSSNEQTEQQAISQRLALIGNRITSAGNIHQEIFALVSEGLLHYRDDQVFDGKLNGSCFTKIENREIDVVKIESSPNFHTGKGWTEPTYYINSYDQKGRYSGYTIMSGNYKKPKLKIKYHDNDQLSEEERVDGVDGRIITTKYDEQGRTVYHSIKNATGSLMEIEKTTYVSDGSATTTCERFDNNGKLTGKGKTEQIAPFRKLSSSQFFDQNGKMYKGSLILSGDPVSENRYVITRQIEFTLDDRGQPVKQGQLQ